MKEIVKDLIIEFHRSNLPAVIERPMPALQLPSNVRKAQVFIGMRRVGKTYLLYQDIHRRLAAGMDKTKILYLNFEDDRLIHFTAQDFQSILNIYFELYPEWIKSKDLVFYFDEIQNIEGWELFIRRLLDKEWMEIFITGSSAKLLSRDIATSMRGRCLTTEVFPLGLNEYLHYRNIPVNRHLTIKEKILIQHHADIYLRRGGFPETLDMPENLYHQTIQSYVNATVFRDVIERYEIKEPHIVKVFLIHCLQNTASSLSITKVHKTLRSRGESVNRNNLYAYLDYFEDAYLLECVPIFDFSARKRQVNPSKIYCMDPGIIDTYSMKPEMEMSIRFENAVYMELRRQGIENIFYFKTHSGKEVDFVTQTTNGQLALYQVSVVLDDKKTKAREINALTEAAQALELKTANIITLNTNEVVEMPNGLIIRIVSYWEWILNWV